VFSLIYRVSQLHVDHKENGISFSG